VTALLQLHDRAGCRLRDNCLEAVEQIERAAHPHKARQPSRHFSRFEPLHSSFRESSQAGQPGLSQIPIQSNPGQALAKFAEYRFVCEAINNLHNATNVTNYINIVAKLVINDDLKEDKVLVLYDDK
jgi:hypothetical protein